MRRPMALAASRAGRPRLPNGPSASVQKNVRHPKGLET
jgi:hypothetical protein